MRALLTRFLAAERGSALMTYMVFTGCWAALIAFGLHYATPKMTTKLESVSATMRTSAYR